MLAHGLVQVHFNKNDRIVNEGDPGNSLYIIQKGDVGIYKGNNRIRLLKEGDSFGEQCIYQSTNRTASCVAETECSLLTLGRDTLN